ncbi:hypothetical protein KS4_37130 [Poriferisphaera corsica]|uniref:DUF202 domain-containing protein n=1 Tax=Poriferisphaera corsica TaxID=2528020 RepID=A0A517YZF6_9BACT|nr:hypothetical protein [Poriferisphaera corsica]QDU35630.1 hypothetical protein KS4_37130 [Poriferisphaera corsica]
MRNPRDVLDELEWDERKDVRREVTRRTRGWLALAMGLFFVLAILRVSGVGSGAGWLMLVSWGLLIGAVAIVWVVIHKRRQVMGDVLEERGYGLDDEEDEKE